MRTKKSYRLSDESVAKIEAESRRLGVSNTSVVEMAVRAYANLLAERKKEVRE
jgi:hypothetical protein